MHVIRLRGPWELAAVEPDALPPARAEVPGDWGALLGDDFVGTARFARRFNQPTNLEPTEQVWLVVTAVDHQARVRLNGEVLGSTAGATPGRFEITPLLRLHNLLEIDVTLTAEVFGDWELRGERAGKPGGIPGEVRLEIEGEAISPGVGH